MIRRGRNCLVRIFMVKKKIGFLIIQTLIESYVLVSIISYIRLFFTGILIYCQKGEEINSSFHYTRFKNSRMN
ncbi:hypothetical protein RDI58_034364 [Solanum bulbocastanum]|uniref:Uncharacterized protein n=1 Tax=Solanum bulbocastanum TaxID=147425 RepID=A0AAN8XW33_SOLBU